jgi:hypothetical protein
VAYSKHLTLTANTVATVDFTINAVRVEVTSRDGIAEVYFTTDGTAPTVGGDNTHMLTATISALEVADERGGNSQVKLISSGTPAVSVRAF